MSKWYSIEIAGTSAPVEVDESDGFEAAQSVQADERSGVPPLSDLATNDCGGEDAAGSQDYANSERGIHQQGTCYNV